MKSWRLTCFVVVLLLAATSFVGFQILDNCHDWGDDFAQYLVQANVMAGNQSELAVSCLEQYSPKVRGPLFSVMLLPIISSGSVLFFGKWIVLAFLLAAALMTWNLMSAEVSWLGSLAGAMLLVLNFSFVRIADQLLPDLPFTFLSLLALKMLLSQDRKKQLWGVVFAGVATGFRDAGWVLLPAVLLCAYRSGQDRNPIKSVMASTVLFVLVSVVCSLPVAFSLSGSWSGFWYFGVSADRISFEGIANNMVLYRDAFYAFFEYEVPVWINSLLGPVLLLLTIAGFFIRLACKEKVIEVYFLSYLLMLLVYPYQDDPHRLMLPVIPIALLYMATTVAVISKRLSPQSGSLAVVALFTVLIFFNFNHIAYSRTGKRVICEKEAKELFAFLKSMPENETIVRCEKPWAVSWFTGLRTIPSSCSTVSADYAIEDKNRPFHEVPGRMVFTNARYSVYRCP